MHELSDLVQVMQESLLEQGLIVNIDGTLYMPSRIFVVEAAVYYNHWVRLFIEQIGKRFTLNWIAGWRKSILVVQFLQQSCCIVLLEKSIFNAKRVDDLSGSLALFLSSDITSHRAYFKLWLALLAR